MENYYFLSKEEYRLIDGYLAAMQTNTCNEKLILPIFLRPEMGFDKLYSALFGRALLS